MGGKRKITPKESFENQEKFEALVASTPKPALSFTFPGAKGERARVLSFCALPPRGARSFFFFFSASQRWRNPLIRNRACLLARCARKERERGGDEMRESKKEALAAAAKSTLNGVRQRPSLEFSLGFARPIFSASFAFRLRVGGGSRALLFPPLGIDVLSLLSRLISSLQREALARARASIIRQLFFFLLLRRPFFFPFFFLGLSFFFPYGAPSLTHTKKTAPPRRH